MGIPGGRTREASVIMRSSFSVAADRFCASSTTSSTRRPARPCSTRQRPISTRSCALPAPRRLEPKPFGDQPQRVRGLEAAAREVHRGQAFPVQPGRDFNEASHSGPARPEDVQPAATSRPQSRPTGRGTPRPGAGHSRGRTAPCDAWHWRKRNLGSGASRNGDALRPAVLTRSWPQQIPAAAAAANRSRSLSKCRLAAAI